MINVTTTAARLSAVGIMVLLGGGCGRAAVMREGREAHVDDTSL
jgi:hypothetical protein